MISALILASVVYFNSGVGGGGGGDGNLLNETFNATGYDDLGWTETTAEAGSSVDEDQTTCPAGTGWSGQCLDTTAGAFGKAYSTNDVGSANAVTYLRARVYVSSEGIGDGSGYWIVAGTADAGDPRDFSAPVRIMLQQVATNQLQLGIAVGNTTIIDTKNITAATLYCIELKIDDTGDTWEWKVDGASEGSGSANPGGSTQDWHFGVIDTESAGATIKWDDIDISSTGYLGC